MQALATTTCPFKNATAHVRRSYWVEPKLVCEAVFTEWTPDGHIRHPSFKALYMDKPAKAISRESSRIEPRAKLRIGRDLAASRKAGVRSGARRSGASSPSK